MVEGRAGKFGRFEATLFKYILLTIPGDQRDDYRERFLAEYSQYSDMPRKVGSPKNEGCVRELDGLEDLDVTCPEHLARWLKESQHLRYQKKTTGREREAFYASLGREISPPAQSP